MKSKNLHLNLVYQTLRRFIYLFAFSSLAGAGILSAERNLKELVDESNKLLRGQSSHSRVTMTITTERWKRTLELEGWNQGREKALMRIHVPAKERGNGTLKVEKEIWNWLPSVERVIKIPPSMLHSSWMGSDFTYEDIVKADSIVKDYTHSLLEKKPEGRGVRYVIIAAPKPEAPVVWGKVILQVLEEDGTATPLREEDYSERGEHIRTIQFSDVRMMGGRKIPTRLECIPHKKLGNKTVLTYQQFDVDVKFEKNFFSLSNLQKPLQ